MNSLILRTTVRLLIPLLLLFSVFLFLRGHNAPGGGFVAGLVAAGAFALYSMGYGAAATRRALRVDPRALIGLGLLSALISGMIGLLDTGPFLSGVWAYLDIPDVGKVELGTPILFDLGVYLAVTGVTLTIVLALEEVE